MSGKENLLRYFRTEIEEIEKTSLYKHELAITSMQGREVVLEDGRHLLNMCANNYLGLCDNGRLINAAEKTMEEKGYGLSSVRFICGTQDIHRKLEKTISDFFGTEDAILYSSCFDANGGAL